MNAIRHPKNKNLTLYPANSYFGLPLMTTKGYLITEYVEKGCRVFMHAINQHTRTAIFRFDLRFPQDYSDQIDNRVISNFTDGLKKAIQRDQVPRLGVIKHGTHVGYIWIKEYGKQSSRPHYHFALFLNKDAYFTMGRYGGQNNLYSLIDRQWKNAIGCRKHEKQLVHACSSAEYSQSPVEFIDTRSFDMSSQIANVFFRLSYMFKADTKVFDGLRSIGTSQF